MPFPYSALVTLLAVLVYAATVSLAGWARWRFAVKAPAMSGHPAFERATRVQANTLEQMPILLPALWLAAATQGDAIAAAIGGVFLAVRVLYAWQYAREPGRRGLFYFPGVACLVALWCLAAWGVVGSVAAR